MADKKPIIKNTLCVQGNSFVIITTTDKKYVSVKRGVQKSMLEAHLKLDAKQIKAAVKKAQVVDEVLERVDYLLDKPYTMSAARNNGKLKVTVTTNPAFFWKKRDDLDEEIITDYNKITGGIIPDLIRVVVSILQSKENRANKIALIGPNGVGKTHAAKLIGAIEMTPADFSNGFSDNGSTGISREMSDKIMAAGIIVADDITKAVPSEIKNTSHESVIRVKVKGGISHPTRIIFITTTDGSLFSSLGGEWEDRLFVFEIPNEGNEGIQYSSLYQKNKDRYAEHTTAYIRNLWLETLKKPFCGMEFGELHKKYNLSEISDTGYQNEQVIHAMLKKELYIKHNDRFYIVMKTELHEAGTEALKELTGMKNSDISARVNRLIGKLLEPKRKKILINGKRVNVYSLRTEFMPWCEEDNAIAKLPDEEDIESCFA